MEKNKKIKEKLKKKAEKQEISLSDYLVYCGLYGKKESKPTLEIIQYMVMLEELGNYIRNKYGSKDFYIERTLDVLWEKLM